jgi:hypothetical protein
LAGVLSVSTIATKLYGVAFSLVVFFFLIHIEWKPIRSIGLLKRKNIFKRFKKNLVLVPIFSVLGALFGLLMRVQFSDMWESGGEKGKSDILGILPGFLDDIVLNLDSAQAYAFFVVVGMVIFFIFWMIAAMVGRESLRTLRCLVKGRALDEKYHLLVFIIGAIIGFVIIYSPFILNPVTLFTQILLNQTIHLSQTSPKEVGGVVYDRAPWWSYLYWTYAHLGIMFVVGIVISIVFMAFRFVRRDTVDRKHGLLFLYTFFPFIFLSALSLKNQNYFVILFPLFAVFIAVQVTSLAKWISGRLPHEAFRNRADIVSAGAIAALLLLPGPLWMTLDDPSLGWDSGYDVAADIVTSYKEEHPGEEITIVAFDALSMEFYLSDSVKREIRIIPLFTDNYSRDILGRPNIYYPDDVLFDMVQSNEIDLFVDEPEGDRDRESLLRRHAEENITSLTWINDELLVYYLNT